MCSVVSHATSRRVDESTEFQTPLIHLRRHQLAAARGLPLLRRHRACEGGRRPATDPRRTMDRPLQEADRQVAHDQLPGHPRAALRPVATPRRRRRVRKRKGFVEREERPEWEWRHGGQRRRGPACCRGCRRGERACQSVPRPPCGLVAGRLLPDVSQPAVWVP